MNEGTLDCTVDRVNVRDKVAWLNIEVEGKSFMSFTCFADTQAYKACAKLQKGHQIRVTYSLATEVLKRGGQDVLHDNKKIYTPMLKAVEIHDVMATNALGGPSQADDQIKF